MIRTIKNYIEKYYMIQARDSVVVGISGGADSVCLLLVLHELSRDMGFSIHPVHINHNLRGDEGFEDEEFTVDFCKKLGYKCEVESVNIQEVANKNGLSTEEAGRNERRRILMGHASKFSNGKIALGHHIDDSVETGIFNLCRGTGLRGLSGIAPVAGQIIRPLLIVTRQNIEAYLQHEGQDYCIDSSNLECGYTRNKIRNKIIPILKEQINEKSVEHIQYTMSELQEITQYMEEDICKAYTRCVKGSPQSLVIEEGLLSTSAPVIARGVIKKALESILRTQRDISRIHVVAVLELFDLQVGRKLSMPKGLMAYRTYEGVSLECPETENKSAIQECIELQIPGQTILRDGRVIETEILGYNHLGTFHENHYTKYFDYDIIGDKLFIDTARDSDYFVINEKGNTQSLKKYAKNEKIPSAKRGNLLCIRSPEEIQWLFDYRVGFKTRVSTETASILKIQIGGEDHGR